jgi:hypothetical protein
LVVLGESLTEKLAESLALNEWLARAVGQGRRSAASTSAVISASVLR